MVCSLKHDFKAPVQYLVRWFTGFSLIRVPACHGFSKCCREEKPIQSNSKKKVLPVTMGKRLGQGKRSGFYNRARNPTLLKVLLIH